MVKIGTLHKTRTCRAISKPMEQEHGLHTAQAVPTPYMIFLEWPHMAYVLQTRITALR